MVSLLFLVILTVCAAEPQDMTGKMFTFPEETDTAYVRLNTSRQSLKAVTVCMRIFSDLDRDFAPFSLASPTYDNEFTVIKTEANNLIQANVRNQQIHFRGLGFKLNTWHSLCSSWDSVTGLVQVWLDGKPSSRRYSSSGSSISGPLIIILGQAQGSRGGWLNSKQSFSFVGMMSDVHMWDYSLFPCEIAHYTRDLSPSQGNVLDWGALSFQTNGRVLIEDYQRSCF